MHGFVDGFQEQLNLASDAIHDTFFAVRSREKGFLTVVQADRP